MPNIFFPFCLFQWLWAFTEVVNMAEAPCRRELPISRERKGTRLAAGGSGGEIVIKALPAS